jgi:hypothetical protein
MPAYEVLLPGRGYSRLRHFSINGLLYIYLDQLYIINTNNYSLDSIPLEGEYYHSMQHFATESDTVIVASGPDMVDLYSYPAFNRIGHFLRKETRQLDLPVINKRMLIYQMRNNELAVFDWYNKKHITSFHSGDQPAYFLGIKIGRFDDTVSWYRLKESAMGPQLYFTTLSGSIFHTDPSTGDTIQYRMRFMGDGNNAGLLTSFVLADMDHDEICDIVATSVDQNIYCISGNGLHVLWAHATGGENQMPLSLLDVTGDKIPDIFGINDNMTLSVLDGKDGAILKLQQLNDHAYQSSPGLADLDADGIVDLLANTDRKTVRIFRLKDVVINNGTVICLPKL